MLGRLRDSVKHTGYRMARSRLLRRGPATPRRIALTFDDGPDPMTTAYLDLLDRLRVPATFFVEGLPAERHPELIREYARRGHQLGGHGFDHTRFPRLGISELDDQLRRTDLALPPQAAGRPWVRPPHGELSARTLGQLIASGYVVAMWSLDSCDYKIHDPEVLAEQVAPSKVAPGEVVLMHEGQPWTLAALPTIVERLRADGYELVTMADLFAA
ncbi:MAG: polysaccharide deacetylase family protein [Kofleriaceae bacterium]